MNATRRLFGATVISLLLECNESGSISDENHLTATNAISHMRQEEAYQLRAQEKHAGKNDSTDKQIAICRVALPALEAAWDAWNRDDFNKVIDHIRAAIETDGTAPKRQRRKRGAQ